MLRKINEGEVFRIGSKPTAIQNVGDDNCIIDSSLSLDEDGNLENPTNIVDNLRQYQTYIITNFPTGLYLVADMDVLVSD